MSMLAEPRRRQKWTLNPRGKHWSDDSNKFGQKMLEKMGWSSGKGLGANMDGLTEHIRLKYKNDQAGVGFSNDDMDKQWTQHQDGFTELLQKLHNGEAAETTATENELSGKSLELKSKQSRARVHYQKFTRGKDVNKYSAKDLASIFGKKDLDEKSQEPEKVVETEQEPEESPPEPIGSSETSHGVVTIKGGSITDYFKNKMSTLSRKITTDVPNDSGSESETYAGFGFSASQKKSETPTKLLKSQFSFVNPALDIASPKEAKDTPRKRKNEFLFENPALDINSPKESKETPRKRKSDFVFDNPALQLEDSTNEMEHAPKKRRSEFAFENGGLELECPQNGGTASAILCSEDITKKKRKKKVIPVVVDGFTNEALNLECHDDEILSSGQFEVPRVCLGLANDALDLTDETNGRKRVTFNETVEYDTDVASGKRKKKKRKNGGKLDKFEVDNEKMKRKKKKGRKDEVAESAFVNQAMDVDLVSQEANDNAANERKSERARKKRDRRKSNLETIAEAPDEEKESVIEVVTLDESLVGEDLEVLSLEAPKKKKKRKTHETEKIAENQQNENLSTTIDISEEDVELIGEILAPDSEISEKKFKKNKKLGEEENEVKKSKRKGRDIVACGQEGIEVTEVKVETVEKVKKSKTRETVSEDSKENIDVGNVVVKVDNLEEVESATKRKKQRKEKKEREEEERTEVKIEEDEKKPVKFLLESGAQSLWDAKVKKEKTRKTVSEDSKENIDMENVVAKVENLEEVESAKKRKKLKKEKKEREKEERTQVKIEEDEKKPVKELSESGAQSPWDGKVKKEKTRKTVSEDSKENIDMENVVVKVDNLEEVESATKRKKPKKEKKEREEEERTEMKIEEDEKKPVKDELLESGAQSPWDAKVKKSKRTFKALFARSPVVNFVGSNINEIKGYGMDLK